MIKLINLATCILTVIAISGCATKHFDSITTTPYPASITELTIKSNGARMPGLIYQAAGKGPHPTVFFLHGYPGNEKSLDIAQAVRAHGWNAVFFHYRGAWGAEGEFSLVNAEADVQAAIHHVKNNAEDLRVDTKAISLAGHSMGGHMALAGITANPEIRCAISYDGANMGARGKGVFADKNATKIWKDYSDTLYMLNGWSGEKALQEISTFGKKLDLLPRLSTLNNRPILLLVADTQVLPVEDHALPIKRTIESHANNQLDYVLIKDDHSFSNNRGIVIKKTIEFLSNECA